MKGRIDMVMSTEGSWLSVKCGDQESRVPFDAGSSIISPAGQAAFRIAERHLEQMRAALASTEGEKR